MRSFLMGAVAAASLLAQDPLSLREAVRMAVERHPSLEAGASRTRAADARIEQARAGYKPRVNYLESWARSNNPVFVFSSLLSQRQFTESNFRIDPLNRPDFLNNFQSQVAVDQTVYDWGATRTRVKAAELGQTVSKEQETATRMGLIAQVIRAYYGAVLAQASLEAATDAAKSAESGVRRAESFREAGMSTDADVLSIRVHLAGMREQEIRRGLDLRVAVAALNEALGLPLEAKHTLATSLVPAKIAAETAAEYENSAAAHRPDLAQTKLAVDIAEQQTLGAKSALLPQFGVRGSFEANRQEFIRKGGSNWMVGGSMTWNLFDGSANRARITEAKASLDAARAQQRQASQTVRLEVFRSWAEARAAGERMAVADAAIAQAEESLRITKNRYESGLSTVTDLLRTETALLEARTRRLAAIHDQRLAAAQLELAAGTLSAESEILQ